MAAADSPKEQNPAKARVRVVELGGLEPPTSWVRYRAKQVTWEVTAVNGPVADAYGRVRGSGSPDWSNPVDDAAARRVSKRTPDQRGRKIAVHGKCGTIVVVTASTGDSQALWTTCGRVGVGVGVTPFLLTPQFETATAA